MLKQQLIDEDETNRVFDYFAICGLPPCLTRRKEEKNDKDEKEETDADKEKEREEIREHDSFLLKNSIVESSFGASSSPSQPSSPTSPHQHHHWNHHNLHEQQHMGLKEPIVDIGIMNKTLNETVPQGYEAIWITPGRHSANLCGEGLFKQNQQMFLVFRRGTDMPPITDIGIYYEGTKEQVMPGCAVIKHTVSGAGSANLNTSNFNFNAERVFVTFRRATDLACNSLAVVDICVIVKGEMAPHSFNVINKSSSRSLLGSLGVSSSIFICYKKSWIPAPQIKYTPSVLYKYPATEHPDLPFPNEVSFFGLPMGAVIESWPTGSKTNVHNTYLNDLEPSFNTFVLNVNSNDGVIMEKVYGACIIFYERFERDMLSKRQLELLLGLRSPSLLNDDHELSLHSNKCLLILSRNPLFDTYKSFLLFLLRKYTNRFNSAFLPSSPSFIPIERYLSYMIYEVPFPTYQKPRVLVNLTENEEDYLTISYPNDTILPQAGSSFIELIHNLGVENSINAFLFVLLQRNIMVHSLRKQVLTGVVEAIACTIFPFLWRYSYIPMCPLVFCEVIEAPGSFIIGMDTRYFDMFEPPENVICIDLDTNSISWTPDREKINLDMLPRKALNALKTRLTQIENDIKELNAFYRQATTSLTNSGLSRAELEARVKRKRRLLELSIREAFLRFMAQMLANYKLFQRTVTRRPDMRAIDRNLTKFFDCDGFIRSKETQCQPFYRELTRTQLFYDCIMNLSFTSELEISLADSFYFFAEVCSKLGLAQSPSGVNSSHAINDDSVKLLELNESDNGQTVVVLPPSTSIGHDTNTTINSVFNYDTALCTTSFPPLRSSMPLPLLVLDESLVTPKGPENSENNTNANSAALETQSVASSSTTATTNQLKKLNALKMAGSTPIGVRAKAERLQAIRKLEAKLTVKTTPNTAAKLNEKKNMIAKTCAYSFLSNAYALWFMYLPDYIMDCDDANKNGLNYAYQVLLQMQKHSLTQPDEICFRIMMQLCLIYSFPTLAVKILLHMRKYKINISPITLSFYNKAMIETSNWPSFQQDRWARIRLTWLVVSRFKHNLRIKEAREKREMKNQRRSNNKSRRRSSKSGPSSTGKKPAVTTPKFKQPQTPQTQTNNKVVIVEVRKSSVTSSSNEQKVTETTTNKIVMSRKIDMNLDTIEIVKEMNIMNNDEDLHVNKSGILTLSAKQHDKLRGNRRHRKRRRKLRRRRSMSYSSLVEVAERIGSSSQSQINKKEAVVDNADPLSAFNTSSGERTPKRVSQSTADEIRKRLFDYKPFSSMDSFTNATATTSTKNSTAQQNSNTNSDFIYNHAKTSILTVPQKTNGETASSVSRSGDFDEDFEDEEGGGEEELEYGQEEEEREIDSDFDDDDEIDEDEEDEDDDDEDDYEYEYEYEENKSRMSVETDRQSLPVGADEEADHKSSSANRNATSNTTTMVFTPLQKGFKSLIKRVGSSIDANPKLTYVKDYISDKSVQIKDVIMSNTSNQQDITTKLKSMSNYQIKAGIQVPQYLNGLVKSSSQAIGFSTPKSTNESRPKSGSETEPKNRVTSHYQHHYYQQQSELAVDLEPISTSDEHFSHLRLDWWGLDKSSLFCLPHSDFDSAINDVLVDIQMTSCNLCEKCNSYLYDEEIMSGWSFNESELKLRCSNCTMYLVPNLYIKIQDYDNIRKHVKTDKTTRSPTKEEAKSAENNSNNNNNNEETEHPFVEEDKPSPKKQQQQQQQRLSQLKMGSVELHVQYLSPFVLRKEFENIILMSKKRTNAEENGGEDMSSQSRPRIIDAAFIVEHSVIFWNLLWYFKRIGVDSGHLATLLLNTRLSELRNKSNEDQQIEVSEFKFRTFVPTPTQLSNNKPASRQHPNVLIKCMWDNLKLKEEDTHHEVPLYVSWLAQHYSDHVASNSKLITVLTHNELKSFRKTQANSRTLGKLYELVVRNIKESDVIVPFRNLIRERIRSKMSFSSIYRELLFLVIVALERDLIDIDAFDTEYRDAYKTLIGGEARDFIRPCDKPPNNLAVWCRRLFSPLLL